MKLFKSVEFVTLKDAKWLRRQRIAGECVSSVLKDCGDIITSGNSNLSLRDLEELALRQIRLYNCIPTFLNYEGFPSAICVAVNKQLVHGPVFDYILQDGDVISVDLGATFEGAIADAARTWIYGNAKNKKHVDLLKIGRKALAAGQNAVKIGNRLGAIGNAIYKTGSAAGLGVIQEYGGHGIDYNKPHSDPFVANKQSAQSGIHITAGMSIAIEPMLVLGEAKTYEASDGWTVKTPGIGCHFENSVTVMEDKIHIITEITNEQTFIHNMEI